ncbi:hypothetical protein PAXINDRAFT_21008 [Paxillus involutus ATCC 200175]|uniref:Uncharacterized protein n=1 Tax=Paxillus involutus ATCC 200175 TaxID=664439 RepID=A0A0C9T2N0_PAXIN|nr:hypothetical protein PAXINDRAFT_21008 [Paxillus involutus ATCC 200175]
MSNKYKNRQPLSAIPPHLLSKKPNVRRAMAAFTNPELDIDITMALAVIKVWPRVDPDVVNLPRESDDIRVIGFTSKPTKGLSGQLGVTNARMGALEADVGAVKAQVGVVGAKVDALQTQLEELKRMIITGARHLR